ncbi:MAG: chemotaxis protein CheW [Phycisphaeraceae bacterium]
MNATAQVTDTAQELTDTEEQLQLVTFEVGEEEFAVDILAVQEIIRMMQLTRVPQSPPSVEGVINLRGQITPVIDLRQRFGLPGQEPNSDSRIIVVEVRGRVLGFIVDRVHEVLRISHQIVDPAPKLGDHLDSDYVRGVGKLEDRLLILLDLERLFSGEELDHAREAAEAA